MKSLQRFPISLRRYLTAFRVRWRLFRLMRAISVGLTLVFAWTLLVCIVDRFSQLSQPVRWACLLVNGLILLVSVLNAVWQTIRPIDWNLTAARIEARSNVFDEQLQTVTSQLLAADSTRASVVMLEQTVQEVERLLPHAPLHRLLPWRAALLRWGGAGLMAFILALLASVPGWQFDRLLARSLFPSEPVDAVTATQLQVWPRSVRVSQGETLTVAANVVGEKAAAAQSRGVDLYLSVDGNTWSRAAMNPTDLSATDSRFEFTIPSIDRDLRYYVRGGDTKSEIYSIQVHRVPAVSEFHILYDYPGYTNHPPVTVTNTDGSIECLVTSNATVTMTATEPLASATWVLGRDRFPMHRTSKPLEWQVSFPVNRSTTSALEMQSAAGVAGRGPSPMPVRAVADNVPQESVLQPPRGVRLEAGDATLVRIAASDDYGLYSLECHIRVNGHPTTTVSIPVPTKPLRREGEFPLDLSQLGLKVGDVVSLIAEGADREQSTLSPERFVLIAPASVTLRASERAVELRHAAALARAWREDLGKARKALDAARGSDPKSVRQDLWIAAARIMSSTTDTASSLRQVLMRALARSDSPALADALAAWIDLTELVLVDPARPVSPGSRADDALSNRLNTVIARTRDLAGQLDAVQIGERASVGLRELKNQRVLVAQPDPPATEPSAVEAVRVHRAAVKELTSWADTWLKDLSLSAGTPNVDAQLQLRIDHERDTLKGIHPPDLVALAQEWSTRPARSRAAAEFPARMQAAAISQGLRADGDLVLARDLELSSRVAAVLAQAPRELDRPRVPGEKLPFKPRPPSSGPTPVQLSAALVQMLGGQNADAARQRLRGWLPASAGSETSDSAEPLAFDASAAASVGAYDAAAKLDAKLAAEILHGSPEQSSRFAQTAAKSLSQLRDIEALIEEQSEVQQVTEHADPDGDALDRQRMLAHAIGELRRPGDGLPTLTLAAAAEANLSSESTTADISFPEPSPDLAARRPLLAAVWHARAASNALDELEAGDDDNAIELWRETLQHQSQVTAYLKLATRHAIHRAALRRLAEVPSLAPIFQPTTAETGLVSPLFGAFDRIGKDWLRPAGGEKVTPPSPDTPAGKVQDQLQAYFDSISKAHRERK